MYYMFHVMDAVAASAEIIIFQLMRHEIQIHHVQILLFYFRVGKYPGGHGLGWRNILPGFSSASL